MQTATPHIHRPDAVRGCPDCGLFCGLPDAHAGDNIHCPRCRRALRRIRSHSSHYILACSLGALIFYLILMGSPIIHVIMYGRFQSSTLLTGAEVLDRQQLWPLAVVVTLTTLLMPFMRLCLLNLVLFGVRLRNPPAYMLTLFRWFRKISPWAMLEVYLLSFFVAYTRLKAIAHVESDLPVYALGGAILLTAAVDSSIDNEEIWTKLKRRCAKHLHSAPVSHKQPCREQQDTGYNGDEGHFPQGTENLPEKEKSLLGCLTCFLATPAKAGDACPRCEAKLHPRKPGSLQHAWAFTAAALIMYLPANYFPIMNITKLGRTYTYNIIGGAQELVHAGFWPLALLVFIASVAIPILKILSLIYMMAATQLCSRKNLLVRIRLYRIIRFIGRWSMVDIFMLSIMVALMQFGQLAQVTSGTGAVCFAAVVILTILAVDHFDTRLMWDEAHAKTAAAHSTKGGAA